MKTKFSERLKELRLENGLTQLELAKALGCTPNAISHWENRGKEPNYYTLVQLAIALKSSTDYLLGLKAFD